MATAEEVRLALTDVMDPELKKSLIELEMVKNIEIVGNRVTIEVALTTPGCPLKNQIRQDIENKVGSLDTVEKVEVVFGEMSEQQKQQLNNQLNRVKIGEKFGNARIIAVGSGKGGVGKSTVTANLAIALKHLGYNVGLLDADIYGFSIPRLLGLVGKKPEIQGEHDILPLKSNGIEVLSAGNFFHEDQALIWRGPMLAGLLQQFITDVRWGKLDYLLIDLPPGTGDVPLSIMQLLPQTYLLLVTTPQASASHVAGRIGSMARSAKVKTIGVVENMSYFVCDHGETYYIFGKGTTEEMAAGLEVPILGRIPLQVEIRENSDAGLPPAETIPEIADLFKGIASSLTNELENQDVSFLPK